MKLAPFIFGSAMASRVTDVAVVAGATAGPDRQGELADPAWVADEQARVHAGSEQDLGRAGSHHADRMARALTGTQLVVGRALSVAAVFRGRRDRLFRVRHAVEGDWRSRC